MVFPRRPCAPVRSRFYARRDLIIVVNDGGSKAFPSTGRKVLRSEQARGLNAPSPSLPRYTAIISLKRADGELTSDRHDFIHPRSKISLRRRFNVARQLCISAFVCFSNRKEGEGIVSSILLSIRNNRNSSVCAYEEIDFVSKSTRTVYCETCFNCFSCEISFSNRLPLGRPEFYVLRSGQYRYYLLIYPK